MLTKFVALFQTGIIIVLSIHPGNPMIKEDLGTVTEGKQVSTFNAFLDVIRYAL